MFFENQRLNNDIKKVEENLRTNVTSKNQLLVQPLPIRWGQEVRDLDQQWL